jgi:hypothetical protein
MHTYHPQAEDVCLCCVVSREKGLFWPPSQTGSGMCETVQSKRASPAASSAQYVASPVPPVPSLDASSIARACPSCGRRCGVCGPRCGGLCSAVAVSSSRPVCAGCHGGRTERKWEWRRRCVVDSQGHHGTHGRDGRNATAQKTVHHWCHRSASTQCAQAPLLLTLRRAAWRSGNSIPRKPSARARAGRNCTAGEGGCSTGAFLRRIPSHRNAHGRCVSRFARARRIL